MFQYQTSGGVRKREKFDRAIFEYSLGEVPYQPGERESSVPCARFLEADCRKHGHVTRARDCHEVVTRSAPLSSCDNLLHR